jgi:uncharacterized protein (DUF58 family)
MKMNRALAISLQIKKYALGPFLGTYRSLFRGKGMEYDEIRKYVPGDDPKAFVWAKLAQMGEAYVKTFTEERDLTVIIALDVSKSMFWNRKEKGSLATEAASALIFSAAASRDRVGLALFSDTLLEFIPPRRGMTHAGKLIETLDNVPLLHTNKTSLSGSFQSIGVRRGPKRAAIFILSDFMCKEEQWEKSLSTLSKQNDVIAIRVEDLLEKSPQPLGWVYTKDPEQVHSSLLVNWNEDNAQEWKQNIATERRRLKKASDEYNIGFVELEEGQDPVSALKTFFEKRRRLLRRR